MAVYQPQKVAPTGRENLNRESLRQLAQSLKKSTGFNNVLEQQFYLNLISCLEGGEGEFIVFCFFLSVSGVIHSPPPGTAVLACLVGVATGVAGAASGGAGGM